MSLVGEGMTFLRVVALNKGNRHSRKTRKTLANPIKLVYHTEKRTKTADFDCHTPEYSLYYYHS